MVPIFLYESHIRLQICADKIAGRNSRSLSLSLSLCFFIFVLKTGPDFLSKKQYLNLLWAKHFPNGTIRVCQRYLENFMLLCSQSKNDFYSGTWYIYYCYYWRGMQRHHHLWHFVSNCSTLIVCGMINNSTVWLLLSRCLTSLRHSYQLKAWMQTCLG